ncbi:armadillo-type protein [Parachaetomium inaequale]|uniref:Armadillo-type protein n=1 Tax=Parachaetomium inaequale TaxID=2588326 RepID=A0AAN6SQV4_9PEZI|nr:armadillo-type protein [Parachaetomium inaequale]
MSSMASLNTMHGLPPSVASQPPTDAASRHHQRSKSSVLRSLMGGGHKRNNSDGSGLPHAPLIAPIATTPAFHMSHQSLAPSRNSGVFHVGFDAAAAAAMEPQRYAHALGELQQNRQERSPERRGRDRGDQPPPSPTKTGFSTISLRPFGRDRDSSKPPKTRDNSPTKPKKAKSATNLAALLRPKSIKNLKQLLMDDGDAAKEKDKENRSPPDSLGSDHHVSLAPPTPIYAQFASQNFGPPSPQLEFPGDMSIRSGNPAAERPGASAPSLKKKPRPKSFQTYIGRKDDDTKGSTGSGGSDSRAKRLTWGKGSAPAEPARPMIGSRSKSSTPSAAAASEMPAIDPKEIDKHLEAMLDRRNIPENQRYKMRNLSNTIKMEFIRQDWAEMQAKLERPPSHDGNPRVGSGTGPATGPPDQQQEENSSASPTKKEKKKHGRGLSLTIVRGSGNKSNPSSPAKKKGDSSLGRHFRTKSSESLVSEPPSPFASGGYGSSFLAKVKGQQLPGDFVAYLQKVRQPELVEVGKLHKLRLLLRNETVAWTDEFIRQGGMEEIVELLHRIMAVEWREEHEDALLHENLLCLKALCTTDMALQYLHSIHATLFPALLHMIFDPDKKGPSEFTTRNIITSLLLTYIECATPQERPHRARAVLGFLRDPEPKEEDRPLEFVLEMRRERPYRVWCKEVVNVTKEVFWIFLHNLNIVALPSADNNNNNKTPSSSDHQPPNPETTTTTTITPAMSTDNLPYTSYQTRHFPRERPPVPAAPYVGGVEWDATNYLASHLDLLNAILSCTGPTAAERNALRAQLRVSGWERCLGGSLRLCKEKFYGAVHDGLRRWVAAAVEDGWDVRDVRYGPPPPEGNKGKNRSRGVSPVKGGGAGDGKEAPPRIEMPRLDYFGGGGGAGGGPRANEPWLG